MFRDYYHYLKAYFKVAEVSKVRFVISILTAIAYKALAVIRPIIAALIIGALTERNADATYYYIGLYAVVYLVYRISYFLNFRAYGWNVDYTYQHMQTKLFNKLITVDNNFTRKISKGYLLNTINTDLVELGELCDSISEFFTTGAQVIIIFIIAGFCNLPAALWMLLSISIYMAIRNWSDKKYNFYWGKTRTENDRYSTLLSQVLAGLSEVKTFNMLPKLHEKLSRIQKRYDKSYLTQRRYFTIYAADGEAEYYVFHSLFYVILILALISGNITIEVLVLLISYHEQISTYINKFTQSGAEIRLAHAAVHHVNGILNYHSEKQLDFGDLDLDDLSGSVTFNNVSLTLERKPILKNLNFRVKAHEFVAIVGHPGAGKTKLFDLILRINKPSHGHIFLDHTDISEFSRKVYTSNVSVANQSPFIFNTSIRKNLDFVDTNIEHQIEACKIANIHNFIETLPQGYNTILRENATNISGGQKQMISIARTILTEAEVLLFDDVTTALDPDTAKLVPRLIKNLRGERTIIMITKKPELMELADRIIVLDHGKVSDIGTHEKLLKRSAVYRSLQVLPSENNLKQENKDV